MSLIGFCAYITLYCGDAYGRNGSIRQQALNRKTIGFDIDL